MHKWFMCGLSKIGMVMTILENFQSVFNTVKKEPIQYRIECINVAINTNMGLYEQELNSEGMSINLLLKRLIKDCKEWNEIENVMNGLKDFYMYFQIEKCVEVVRVETLLKLTVYRGYITTGELNELLADEDYERVRIFLKNLGGELLEKPTQDNLILFTKGLLNE